MGGLTVGRPEFLEEWPSMEEMMANGAHLLVSLALREMARENYSEYLQTNHWQAVRLERLKIDGFRCVVCLSREKLNVHHIDYSSLGDEKMEHLVTLCREHHKAQHEVLRQIIRAQLEEKMSQ